MSENKKDDKAILHVDGKSVEIDVLPGTTGERALNLGRLKAGTGCMAFDPGMANTAVCRSAITFVDGEKGVLLHRGYTIEDLAEHCAFVEVAYLLIHGMLPTISQRQKFSRLLNIHSMLHQDMISFFGN